MPSQIWVLDGAVGRERAEALLGSLAAREVRATLREVPGGFALVLDEPPAGIERPAEVIRSSTIEVPTGSQLTRRNFLDTFAVALSAAAIASGAVLGGLYASPPHERRTDTDELDVGSVSEIEAQGSRTFRFGREPCVVIAAGGKFHALSTICSHLGCIVQWVPKSQHLACPCHRASFDLEGNVREGPPPRPLTAYSVTVHNDRVVVRRRTTA
jgi:cytochrome b6-f complex iron-sulfur subunit